MFIYLVIIGWRAETTDNLHTYQAASSAWFTCLFLNWGDLDICGAKPNPSLGLGSWYLLQGVVCGQGVSYLPLFPYYSDFPRALSRSVQLYASLIYGM